MYINGENMKIRAALIVFTYLVSICYTNVGAEIRYRPKIVNGHPAATGSYPFLVGIENLDEIDVNNPFGHWCGGSLISSNKVLTAAHCFALRFPDGSLKRRDLSSFRVTANITDYSDSTAQIRSVQSIAIHPDYNLGGLFDFDVAVLTLDSPVTGLPTVALGNQGHDKVGKKATVAGWGAEFSGSPFVPTHLQSGVIRVIPSKSCIDLLKREAPAKYDSVTATDEMIAAEFCASSKPVDACQGDSGGPVFREIEGKIVQIGIVSWGINCAGPVPGFYTRISNPSVTQFILQNIN